MKDLNLLYVFEALWTDHSATQAAGRLGVSQAAVSSSLKRLRQVYDDPLFTLVGRKMQPTPLAAGLAPQLLDALAAVRRTMADPQIFDPERAKRVFTIRTRDIGEVICLPRVLAALSRVAPGVGIRSVFMPIPETLDGMASGLIDLSLGYLPALETGIHRKGLFAQHYVCVLRSDHPIAKSDLTLKLFKAQDHLVTEYSGRGHAQLEQALTQCGLRDRIKVRMPHYLSAPHLIANSDLLWLVPALLAETLVKHHALRVKPHPLHLPDFEIALYWHERYHRDPAIKWLRDLIAKELQPLRT